jgi:hypothetical protein
MREFLGEFSIRLNLMESKKLGNSNAIKIMGIVARLEKTIS